jgi:hypothetical protein
MEERRDVPRGDDIIRKHIMLAFPGSGIAPSGDAGFNVSVD